LKFSCQFCSNTIAVFLCSIYLEINELHFCSLDRYLKRFIIERVQEEKIVLLKDLSEENSSENNDAEDTLSQSYVI
jgi:hypothetical protein